MRRPACASDTRTIRDIRLRGFSRGAQKFRQNAAEHGSSPRQVGFVINRKSQRILDDAKQILNDSAATTSMWNVVTTAEGSAVSIRFAWC